MTMIFFTIVLGLTIALEFTVGSEILLQAEDMQGALSETIPRSHASEKQSVHLYTGDSLETELCFMTDTKFTLNEIRYSNDGPSDLISITLDKLVLDEFTTVSKSNWGKEWDVFRSHHSRVSTVTEGGRHILKVTVLRSDQYGVEIDFIKFSVNDSHTLDSLRCKSICFEDTSHPYCYKQAMSLSGSARAVQRSVKTKCAEEDNINIPVFHDSASSLNFVVTASLPKYRSFQNNRDPNWTDCKMVDAFWKYKDINFSDGHITQIGTSELHITKVSPGTYGTKQVWVIEVEFELEGPSTGSADSEIGTIIHLQNIRYDGFLALQFQYYDRYNIWSDKQDKIVINEESSIKFVSPDFSFREGKGNKIRIEVYADLNSQNSITIGDLHMYKRTLRPDKSTTLYKDEVTVIDGVDIDMWWRINETMSVTIKGEKQTFKDVDYIRISRRETWAEHGFSEVFVLYQDANIRLLPTTPHGFDYIPFGSSVIIGQTDPLSNRPCAPISHVDIDPKLLQVTIFFMDSNVVTQTIQTTRSETQLHVSYTHFMRDVKLHPFFTFRSMYVSDDNNDVDHISADDGISEKINEQWNELPGNFFAFYRKHVSKHNTQSPDISMRIMSST
ncbi:uncharacterized protein LOC123551587 [Mercenaria mercenaria]|uniref:uncharacterized protein LOC123551587 n=1 Tax=Mercenaria mercenaria TaxID=6596 RepID=UPI00234F133E|nr:uncharacterized protein LOC123551587 [Mercenaria mercenaria]